MNLILTIIALSLFSNAIWAASYDLNCVVFIQKEKLIEGAQTSFVAKVPLLLGDKPYQDGSSFEAVVPLLSANPLLIRMHFINVPEGKGLKKSLLFQMVLPQYSSSSTVDPLGFYVNTTLDSERSVVVNCDSIHR